MRNGPICSIPNVCEVLDLRGPDADEPTLLLEVPHGATCAGHFTELRSLLAGDFPDDLRDFFFVNTDVGSPELARRVAELYVAGSPTRRALLVRSLIPRTFVDCNRIIDTRAEPRAWQSGAVTPGLHVYVRDAADRRLLCDRYEAYVDMATAAYAQVCGRGGLALMLHTFAPRSLDVPVDDQIVERLRAEYEPDRIASWPLRPEVDLIANDPDGARLASSALVDTCQDSLQRAGYQVEICDTYALHDGTMARGFAETYPGHTLCLEIRRDLLVQAFTPFTEMSGHPLKVEPIASALSDACATALEG